MSRFQEDEGPKDAPGVIVGRDNRRKWDDEYFKNLAAQREEGEASTAVASIKKKLAPIDPSERKPVKSRDHDLNLEKMIGKRQVLADKKGAEIDKTKTGFYCNLCDCVLKDNNAFLDHINGRKHLAIAGHSIHTTRSTLQDVRERLSKKRDREEVDTLGLAQQQLQKAKEDDEALRAERRARKKMKRQKRHEDQDSGDDEDDAVDDELAAFLGKKDSSGGDQPPPPLSSSKSEAGFFVFDS